MVVFCQLSGTGTVAIAVDILVGKSSVIALNTFYLEMLFSISPGCMGSSLLAPWGIFLLWRDHSHHWYFGLLVLYWHHQSSDRRKLARRRHSYRCWWMMEQHLRPHPKLSKSLLVVGRDFLFLLLFIDILDFLCYIFTRKVTQSPFGLSTGRTIKVAWAAFFLASHITFIKSISPYCLSSKKFTDYWSLTSWGLFGILELSIDWSSASALIAEPSSPRPVDFLMPEIS